MTRISFYILKTELHHDRLIFACRLAEKAYHQGHQIYIHTDSSEQTEQMDAVLWSFRADSFVPHEINSPHLDVQTPVVIDHQGQPPRLMDVLINLSPEQPLFFSQFERMAEIIDANQSVKVAGRQRFQFYQQRGYDLETFNL